MSISYNTFVKFHVKKFWKPQYGRVTVKPVLSGHSKRTQKVCFQYKFSLNAGQKYFRMLPLEHSAILSTFIKLPFSIKTFVLSVFKWLLKTGFTVYPNVCYNKVCYKGTALYLVWTRLLLKNLPDLELHSV